MKRINYLITDENIVVNFDGNTFTINKKEDEKKYKYLLYLIKEQGETEIIEFLKPIEKLVKYQGEYFFIDEEGSVFFNDRQEEEIPIFLGEKLIDFINLGLDILPVIKFWSKLRDNPSEDSKKDLYLFLTNNKHPLTEDGDFIAYKKVNKVAKSIKLVDNRTRKMDNSPGVVVSMPRDKVDPRRSQTCSYGLHIASMSYATSFSGDTLIEVSVNPKDVVVVPTEYKSEKMRVCKYKVLNIVKPPKTKVVNKETEAKNRLLKKLPKTGSVIKKPKSTNKPLVEDITKKQTVNEKDTSEKIERELTINISKLTAKQIIAKVKEVTSKTITVSDKNKKLVIKHATKILVDKGYTVKV